MTTPHTNWLNIAHSMSLLAIVLIIVLVILFIVYILHKNVLSVDEVKIYKQDGSIFEVKQILKHSKMLQSEKGTIDVHLRFENAFAIMFTGMSTL